MQTYAYTIEKTRPPLNRLKDTAFWLFYGIPPIRKPYIRSIPLEQRPSPLLDLAVLGCNIEFWPVDNRKKLLILPIYERFERFSQIF